MNLSPAPRRRFATRRTLAVAVSAGALLAGVALLLQERPVSAAVPPAAPAASLTVVVTTPQRVTLPRTIAADGSVAARDELVIGSDAAGVRLLEVLADVGSVVRRGQLLARGDDAQLLAQRAQQDAQVRQARAELAQAAANLERAERIEDSGVFSVEALQTRRTAREAAAARLELAEAQRRELDVRLAHTRVLAPADGVIARRSATVGAVVQSGHELFRLIRDEALEWHAELPAHALAQVRPGAPVALALDDGGVVEGRVRLVAPTIDARTRNGTVHVALPRAAPLKAGAHASGRIVVESASMLVLPESAIVVRDGQPHVFVVGGEGIARLARLATGTRTQGLVEVTGGLEPGARVVAAGAGFVKDGERVQVAPEAAQATRQPRVQEVTS